MNLDGAYIRTMSSILLRILIISSTVKIVNFKHVLKTGTTWSFVHLSYAQYLFLDSTQSSYVTW